MGENCAGLSSLEKTVLSSLFKIKKGLGGLPWWLRQ